MGTAFDPLEMVTEIPGAIMGAIGAADHDSAVKKSNEVNYERQKEFAQNGIQWRVADAKAAGLSPLAALGGAGPSYSPDIQVGDGMSDWLGREGQNISRAAAASLSHPDQTDILAAKHQRVMEGLDEQAAKLKLELMKADLAKATQQPGIPSAFVPVKMPDGTVIQVPGHELGVSGFFPYLNQGLGAYGASLGIGNYLSQHTFDFGMRGGSPLSVAPTVPNVPSWIGRTK